MQKLEQSGGLRATGRCQWEGGAMRTPVTETHWAKGSRETWQELAEAIPAICETEMKLWQLRVDRGVETPHMPHVHLFPLHCQRYHSKDGRFCPVEPEETLMLLVVAESRREAYQKATAQLVAHGYGANEWAIGSNRAPLILT